MEYTVIKKTDANDFIRQENEWLDKEWKPSGGI